MRIKKVVDLGKEYSKILTSRDLVIDIKNKYDSNVILDFKNVEFISRSFAHELLLYIYENENVKIINTNKNIENMLAVVRYSIENKSKENKVNLARENILSVVSN